MSNSWLDAVIADIGDPNGYFTRIFLPLVAALFGAFFGAQSSAKFSSSAAKKHDHQEYLRSLATATSLAATVFGSASSLKRQNVKKLYEEFKSAQTKIAQDLAEIEAASTTHESEKKEIRVDFDLRTISMHSTLAQDLVQLVVGHLHDTRMTTHAVAIRNSYENCALLIGERNKWISEFEVNVESEEMKARRYFGFEFSDGIKDDRYNDFVSNLYDCNNDLIFHSYILHTILLNALIDSMQIYRKKYGSSFFEIAFHDLNNPENSDMLPDLTDYKEWLEKAAEIKKPWKKSWKTHYNELREKAKTPEIPK